MDLSFGRARRARRAAPVRLDYPQLIAILAATQAGSRTAQLENRLAQGVATLASPVAALVVLLESGSGWMDAARLLDGRFHPGGVGKAPSTIMTSAFTLAG